MKTTSIFLSSIFFLSFVFTACQKSTETKQESVQHLLSSFIKNTTDSVRYNYYYDEAGRIKKITQRQNNDPETTLFDIDYQSNEIILYYPPTVTGHMHYADTIHLFTDANGQVLKKVNRGFFHYDIPTNAADWDYFYDTTTYQYNADGLMISGIRSGYDTSWYTSGTLKTTGTRNTGTIAHTISGKNIIKIVEINSSHGVTHDGANTYTSGSGSEMTRTFDYSQLYSNKTDFTNAAVLNEVNPFTELPINANYENQPNKVTSVFKVKDENGIVFNTSTTEENLQFTYNEFGLMSFKNYTTPPTGITTYVYGKIQ